MKLVSSVAVAAVLIASSAQAEDVPMDPAHCPMHAAHAAVRRLRVVE